MDKDKWAIMTGGPDGFNFIGPYDDHDDATRYADTINDAPWWIIPLQKPMTVDQAGMQELNSELLQQGRAS